MENAPVSEGCIRLSSIISQHLSYLPIGDRQYVFDPWMLSPKCLLTHKGETTRKTKFHFNRYPGLPSMVQELPESKSLNHLHLCPHSPFKSQHVITVSYVTCVVRSDGEPHMSPHSVPFSTINSSMDRYQNTLLCGLNIMRSFGDDRQNGSANVASDLGFRRSTFCGSVSVDTHSLLLLET